MAPRAGERTTLLLNLPQATAEETGRELHRIAKTYRSEAYATIGSYMGLNLLVRSEYDFSGTFDRNTFYVEGRSGLKYRCGMSGALPLGFVESAQYPKNALEKLPGIIDNQRKKIAKLQSELPTLQEIVSRRWSKADELARLRQECRDLQRRIDEALKEAEQKPHPAQEDIDKAA